MSRTPRIAVILPVHNGADFLAEAIQSVLSQTFTDRELLVIDDGSADRTPEILAGFASRVRVIRFPQRRGLVAALNVGISESRSEFVARMDSDDVCLPNRLQRQVDFLDANAEVGVCGTWIREFGESQHLHAFPAEPEQIRARMFFGWAMCHPTLLIRRAMLQEHYLRYSDQFPHSEDLDLLLRASAFTKLANIPEVLLRYRVHRQQVASQHREEQRHERHALLVRQLRQVMPDATKEDETLRLAMADGAVGFSALPKVDAWLHRLEHANGQSLRYDRDCFRRELREAWHSAHLRASSAGLGVLASYWRSPLASLGGISLRNHARLIANCLHKPMP
jgi:hypothetical protein